MLNLDKLPPQNIEAEQSVLCSILIENSAMLDVQDILGWSDFYRTAHQLIFRAMHIMHAKKEAIDLVTLSNFLKSKSKLEEVGGPASLSILVDVVPTGQHAKEYAQIVRDRSVDRQIIKISSRACENCFNDSRTTSERLNAIQKDILALQNTHGGNEKSYCNMADAVNNAMEYFERVQNSTGGVIGIPTGFRRLDLATGGLQGPDLIFIAARPGMGKTAFALNIARHVTVFERVPTLFFSMEMSTLQLMLRQFAAETGINGAQLKAGPLGSGEMAKLVDAAPALYEAPLFIDEMGNQKYQDIRRKARQAVHNEGVGLIIIDYLQLGQGDKRDGVVNEISSISNAFKALAKELNIPVIALSQLNRSLESRDDKRPRMSDLRGSGSLEQDADSIWFLYREYEYNKSADPTSAELRIAKQRSGPKPMIGLNWDARTLRFTDTVT